MPPRQKTFGEAKNQVRANYKRGKRTEIRDEWLSDIRKKNPVKIFESKVAHLFPEDGQIGAEKAVTDTTKG